ncbi:MAG: prephenate dehydratase [Xanthomonadales bacterium]|nr:prephenate dehydratase [Xanthomonadales bacterium]MDH4019821.1 prephenate dehydratase [Xanthomonadales bacterium]
MENNKKEADSGKQKSLGEVRQEIDALDAKIQALISDRARLAGIVRQSKGKLDNAVDYYRPEREAQVLRAVRERNQGPISDAEMLRLFREIMSVCLAQQEPLKVAYLGPEGTFTQQAVNQHFGHSVQALGVTGIDDVFTQVESAEADFGVVPVENSNQGIVSHTLDRFVDSDLKICGEIEMAIHHNLLSQAKSLAQIERVYSHQQSLSQCRNWIRQHLPLAECIAVSSNAEAARRVRHSPDAAAISSKSAADIYGVPLLFARIEDRADNATRFLVIGRQLLTPSGDDKTSLLLAGDEGPGALHSLLSPLANHSLNMSRIESRPASTGRWSYVFYIDVDGHAETEPLKSALLEMQKQASLTRVLGSYPKAVSNRLTANTEADD